MKPFDHKFPRPTDFLPDRPFQALESACAQVELLEINYDLQHLFVMVLSHEFSHYDELEDRGPFVHFYLHLVRLVESLYLRMKIRIELRDNPDCIRDEVIEEVTNGLYFHSLSGDDVVRPVSVQRSFCEKYRWPYAQAEIFDFIDSAGYYKGPLQDRVRYMSPHEYYLFLLVFAESAYILNEGDYEELDPCLMFLRDDSENC